MTPSVSRLLRTALPILLTALLLTSANQVAAQECRQLVEQKCGTCHFATRACPGIHEGKSRSSWKRVMNNMIEMGMQVHPQEQDQLVQCLAGTDTGVRTLCAASKK